MECKNCRNEIEMGNLFECPNCGATICGTCGQNLKNICPYCFSSLEYKG